MSKTPFHRSAVLFGLVLLLALSACGPAGNDANSSPTQRSNYSPAPTIVAVVGPTATSAPAQIVIVRAIGGPNSSLSVPVDVAMDAHGNLYVLEAGSERVDVLDPQGSSLRSWGSHGSGKGQFDLNTLQRGVPYGYGGIALDQDGNVYVADGFNHRVQKFDSTGKFLLQWGSWGFGDGQFYRPVSLTIDKAGHVYVIDDRASRVQEFDLNGKFIRKWGDNGSGKGQFFDVGNITAGPDGNLYVADYGNKRIQVFSPEGKFLGMWSVTSEPVGIAVDASGRVYVTDRIGYLTEYDVSGEVLRVTKGLSLLEPVGLIVSPDGLIYIADQHNNRVLVVKPGQ